MKCIKSVQDDERKDVKRCDSCGFNSFQNVFLPCFCVSVPFNYFDYYVVNIIQVLDYILALHLLLCICLKPSNIVMTIRVNVSKLCSFYVSQF